MSKPDKFHVKYEIDDGYVGGARPQRFNIGADNLEDGMTDAEIEQLLDDMTHEDFLQKASPCIDNRDEFVAWAKAQLTARDNT